MKNGMKHKLLNFENCQVKVSSTEGGSLQFSGYASVFNGIDAFNDTVVPGAFAKSLKEREIPVRMRWNHFGPVIGKWLELKEDDRGLFVSGELTPDHSIASDVGASMKHGSVDGMSIGYRVHDSEMRGEVQVLKEIELVEISIVEEPADRAALVSEVKSCIENATTLKELESILRDAGGFTKASAAAFISRVKGCLGDPGHANSESAGIDLEVLVNETFQGLYDSLTERIIQNGKR